MVPRNKKSMMKLVRLPNFRPLLLMCEILRKFEKIKGERTLGTRLRICMGGSDVVPYKSFKFFE